MKYYLDISAVEKLPKWMPDNTPTLIPIQRGRYFKEWEVIEEQMPVGWRGEFKLNCKRLGAQQNNSPVLPVGFNSNKMPEGAVIKELP